MKVEQFKLVYINSEYLKALHNVDSEVMFQENNNYEIKPHLGILISCNGHHYAIPLTSAKEKHKNWRDVTATNYRIYETIDIRIAKIDKYDIMVAENDYNKLRLMGVKPTDYCYFKKRILSVLEIKKMIPVPTNQYSIIDLDTASADIDTEQRRILMQKEYFFLRKYLEPIVRKAKNIYEKQIESGIIQRFHCDYKKLEAIADKYQS